MSASMAPVSGCPFAALNPSSARSEFAICNSPLKGYGASLGNERGGASLKPGGVCLQPEVFVSQTALKATRPERSLLHARISSDSILTSMEGCSIVPDPEAARFHVP